MVAGAVHVLGERLDLLDFSTSYIAVRQITVKRGQTVLGINILKTFQCFTPDLWFLGLFLEVGKCPNLPMRMKRKIRIMLNISAAADGILRANIQNDSYS